MNIPFQFLQAEGQFSIPGTRRTVNGELIRRAVGQLPMRDRGEAFDYLAEGTAPSEKIAEALRQLIVELAEESSERDVPCGTSRSHL